MGRVRGDNEAIASSTNSCGTALRCLTAKRVSSNAREAVSRRGFDMELGYSRSLCRGSSSRKPDGPVRRFLKELIWMPVGPVTNWLAGMKIAAGISALIISRRRACFQKNSYTIAGDGERSTPRGLRGQDD